MTKIKNGIVDRKGDLKFGYLDKKGKWAIPPKFDYADPFENGIAKIQWNSEVKYIDEKGNFVPAPEDED